MRRVALVVTAVLFAVVGPRLSAPHDRAAGEAFVYEPPEGFVEAKDAGKTDEREWVHVATGNMQLAPRITLKLTKTTGTVEPADLAKIASGMPGVLEPSGVTWSDVRHEMRTRSDGTRVGLIEGRCEKKTEEILPGIQGKLEYRRLIFVFPIDGGTAITTALYGNDEVEKWQPVVESTLLKAHGVALRVPPPPGWMYLAWAGAGLVLAWLTVSLVEKRAEHVRRASMMPPAMPPGMKSEKDKA
jgi:hypothetical protein